MICAEYPIVTKRDGSEEEFSCEKIRTGLSKAFKKEPGVEKRVDRIFNGVISEIISKHPNRVASETIGAIIVNLLRGSEPAAYMRFASVYKKFSTANDFASEFERISSEDKWNDRDRPVITLRDPS
jgi:transcriptional repressor NrdR